MNAFKRTMAIVELLFVFPAALFMTALFLREVQPLTHTGVLVDWFRHHVILGLYVSLLAMPLLALIAGSTILLRSWRADSEFREAALKIFIAVRAQMALLLVAGATAMAGVILVLVAMHMLTE